MVTCDANDNDEINIQQELKSTWISLPNILMRAIKLKPCTHDNTNRLISFSSFLTQGNCPLMQDETVAANTNFPFLKGGLQKKCPCGRSLLLRFLLLVRGNTSDVWDSWVRSNMCYCCSTVSRAVVLEHVIYTFEKDLAYITYLSLDIFIIKSRVLVRV